MGRRSSTSSRYSAETSANAERRTGGLFSNKNFRRRASRGSAGGPRASIEIATARQSLRIARSTWRRRSGSATRSIPTIFPRAILKPSTTRGRPPWSPHESHVSNHERRLRGSGTPLEAVGYAAAVFMLVHTVTLPRRVPSS